MPISKKRLNEIKAIDDKNIDYSDISKLDKNFWKEAEVVLPKKKVPISLRLDQNVLDWFKSQGKGYQSRINAILASFVKAQQAKISKTTAG